MSANPLGGCRTNIGFRGEKAGADGIYLDGSNATITNNVIFNNEGASGIGDNPEGDYGPNDPTISNNVIVGNECGINKQGSGSWTLNCNDVWGNDYNYWDVP